MKNRLHGRHLACAVLVCMGLVLGGSPAHADSSPVNATVALTGGELSIQLLNNSALPPIVLNGTTQRSNQVGYVRLGLTDATGTGLGYTLAISATPLSGSNGSLKRPLRLKMGPPPFAQVVAGSGTLYEDRGSFISPNEDAYYWTIPSTPATLYSAANGKGMGQWILGYIRWSATICPEDLAGEYTSTVTFTLTQTPP